MTTRNRRLKRAIALSLSAPLILFLFLGYVQCRRRTCADFQSRRNPCKNNLRHVAAVIEIYALENGGWCPPDLSPIYLPHLGRDWRQFFCPYARRDGKVGRYVYLGAGERYDSQDGTVPLMADYPDNHGSGGSVIYNDGHVEVNCDEVIRKHLLPGQELLENRLRWYEY